MCYGCCFRTDGIVKAVDGDHGNNFVTFDKYETCFFVYSHVEG